MKWMLKTVVISDLKGYEKNPRSLSDREHRQLSDSIDRFGLIDKPVVNANNIIIGGHQRVEVLKAKGSTKVECWVSERLLDDKEMEELNIRLNRNNGSFDFDILANEFDIGDLLTWGFDEDELGLGKEEKPKKEPKPVISLEFYDRETMVSYIEACEEMAQKSGAKLKVKG